MQTPVRIRGAYRGRHHVPVLATFRPTWRQALCRGLGAGAAGTAALALALLVDGLAGSARLASGLPDGGWLVVLAPLPVGALGGLAVARRSGVRLDGLGVHRLPPAGGGFAPWMLVADVRAERRRRRTVIMVYLRDGSIRRLGAPYDGELLGHDPQFERKLFMICHLWETHRACRGRG